MKIKPIFFLLAFTLFINLPLLSNPMLFLERGNDLQEFFWPIIYFVKKSILVNHIIPLWNPVFLSGTPLLPDPQSPLFYLPNIIFLIFNMDTAFILSILIHSFIGGLGIYLLTKKILASFLYMSSPILASFLEAGHFGIIQAFAWVPIAIYFSLNLNSIKKSCFLAIILALIFFTHLPTFLIICLITLILGIKKLKFLILAFLLCLGLVSIGLLPQLEWQPFTTRSILLEKPDIYPKWSSKIEFIQAVFIPWYLSNLSTEKIVTIGIFPSLLALIGFLKLKNKKIAVIFYIGFLLLVLGTISPIYFLLIKIPVYNLLRISSRFYIPIFLLTIYFCGLALRNANKFKYILIFLALIESVYLSWHWLARPITISTSAPDSIYQFLANDHDKFRVFCLTRCLTQKKASIFELELVDGYTTLPQKNIYQYGWEITDSFWDYYTLSIPPLGLYTFDKINPDAKHLGLLNTKYIISPYALDNRDLTLVKLIEDYKIYKNNLFMPRVIGGEIISYTPNRIEVNTNTNTNLILSEVYSPGWKAYSMNKQIEIKETPLIFRSVNLNSGDSIVKFEYFPDSFKIGVVLTSITLTIIFYLNLIYIKNE